MRKRPPPKARKFVPPQKKSVPEDIPIVEWDHVQYVYACDCQPNCDCVGCVEKGKEIMALKERLFRLKQEYSVFLEGQAAIAKIDRCAIFLKTDSKAKAYTGLISVNAFDDLHALIEEKAKKLKYWYGEVNTSDRSREFKESPQKMGPARKLSTKEELLLVLMKVRLGITSSLLSDIMDISEEVVATMLKHGLSFYHISKDVL